MPRGIAKENLPSKMCVVCQRPFTWRKVWERCWDEVQTCSDRCKSERKKQKNAENKAAKTDGLIVMPAPDKDHETWRPDSPARSRSPPKKGGKNRGEE